MAFSLFTELDNHYHTKFQNVFTTRKEEILCPSSCHSTFAPGFFLYMESEIGGLLYFHKVHSSLFKVHTGCDIHQHSFPLMARWFFVLWVCHLLFIYSPVGGHLGWSLALWIILLWVLVCKFMCGHMFSFLLGRYVGAELPGHIVVLCLTRFLELFSKVSAPFCHPTSNRWGF